MELRLKEFRKACNYSQEQIAEKLKTTQQTIQRWETGKAEPPLAALRDLAVIFGTSVDDLVGTNPFSKEAVTNSLVGLDQGEEHFWGHLGIQFPGAKLSRWYPVTAAEATRIENQMSEISEKSPWLVISTLNDRMLILNALTVKQVSLLDDAADQPDDDWELGWDGYSGLEPETYRALGEWALEDESELSDKFKEGLEKIIEEHKLTPDLVQERILSVAVRYTDGSEQRFMVEPDRLYGAVCDVEAFPESCVFDLTEYGEGRNVFVPGAALALLDMPLHQVVDAAKEALAELEEETPKGRKAGRDGEDEETDSD